jgi:hypothetical protein
MAMLFAASHPERTLALILFDTAARVLRDVDYPWGLPADRVPGILDRLRDDWGTGNVAQVLAPSMAHDARFRHWLGRYERLSIPPQAHIPMYASHFEWDLRHALPSIRVPTLVLHRVGNRYVRVGHGRYLAEHSPSEVRGAAGRRPSLLRGRHRGYPRRDRGVPDRRGRRPSWTACWRPRCTDIVSSMRAAMLGDRGMHCWKPTTGSSDASSNDIGAGR